MEGAELTFFMPPLRGEEVSQGLSVEGVIADALGRGNMGRSRTMECGVCEEDFSSLNSDSGTSPIFMGAVASNGLPRLERCLWMLAVWIAFCLGVRQ